MGRPRSKPAPLVPIPPRAEDFVSLSRVEFDKALPLLTEHGVIHLSDTDSGSFELTIRGGLLHVGRNVVPLSRMLAGVKK